MRCVATATSCPRSARVFARLKTWRSSPPMSGGKNWASRRMRIGVLRTTLWSSKPFSARCWFYSAWTRTLETFIKLIGGVELLTWVCQPAVCGDAMLLDKMMK